MARLAAVDVQPQSVGCVGDGPGRVEVRVGRGDRVVGLDGVLAPWGQVEHAGEVEDGRVRLACAEGFKGRSDEGLDFRVADVPQFDGEPGIVPFRSCGGNSHSCPSCQRNGKPRREELVKRPSFLY